MKITVHLLAFNEEVPSPTRIVDVPQEDADRANLGPPSRTEPRWLDLVFYYGQNDFQPQPVRSVSVGDVIELPDGSKFRVLGVGFERLAADVNFSTLERGAACSPL